MKPPMFGSPHVGADLGADGGSKRRLAWVRWRDVAVGGYWRFRQERELANHRRSALA